MRNGWIAMVLTVLLVSSAYALGDGKVHMYFVDVGQGDSTLLIGPAGTSCLIDGGASNSYSTNIIAAMNDAIAAGLTDNTLDYIVVTHMHSDHLYGLDEVETQFPGGLIAAYDRTGSYSSTAFDQYDAYFGTAGLKKRQAAETFSLDSATMTYLGRGGSNSTSDENNNGVIYRLDYGNFQCWLGGDLGSTYEAPKGQICGPVEFYQVNHHGSATSSQTEFLSYIQPIAHAFSYGIGNSYGHPTADAISRLDAVGSARYDTPYDHYQGHPYIYLESDGVAQFSVNGHTYAVHESVGPTPTPTPSPTASPSPTPSPSPTASPSPTPSLTASPTPTLTPSPTPSPSPTASPTATPATDVVNLAVADFSTANGTITGGSFLDTQALDGSYESLTEAESGGKPSSRYSVLNHVWTFNVASGASYTFYLDAWHPANADGDDFVFAYSRDGAAYTTMMTVTKSADDGMYQAYAFPEDVSGTLYIRVQDTDSTAGNRSLDTVLVDHMYVFTAAGGSNPTPTPTVSPTPPPVGDPASCHVASITASTASGSRGQKLGQVTVTILDDLGGPVAGATVSGTFAGSYYETVSAPTDGSGVAILLTTTQTKSPAYTFCVDSVTHTLPYAPGDNAQTCATY